jgi:hypothetical protein
MDETKPLGDPVPVIDDKEFFIRVVGRILDHPSVYMGGASHQNRRKAEAIWKYLSRGVDGWKISRDA